MEIKANEYLIPMYYTKILHPKNKYKELVIMDDMWGTYRVAWRNNKDGKIGRVFACRKVVSKKGSFLEFKGKLYNIKKFNKVW